MSEKSEVITIPMDVYENLMANQRESSELYRFAHQGVDMDIEITRSIQSRSRLNQLGSSPNQQAQQQGPGMVPTGLAAWLPESRGGTGRATDRMAGQGVTSAVTDFLVRNTPRSIGVGGDPGLGRPAPRVDAPRIIDTTPASPRIVYVHTGSRAAIVGMSGMICLLSVLSTMGIFLGWGWWDAIPICLTLVAMVVSGED